MEKDEDDDDFLEEEEEGMEGKGMIDRQRGRRLIPGCSTVSGRGGGRAAVIRCLISSRTQAR